MHNPFRRPNCEASLPSPLSFEHLGAGCRLGGVQTAPRIYELDLRAGMHGGGQEGIFGTSVSKIICLLAEQRGDPFRNAASITIMTTSPAHWMWSMCMPECVGRQHGLLKAHLFGTAHRPLLNIGSVVLGPDSDDPDLSPRA